MNLADQIANPPTQQSSDFLQDSDLCFYIDRDAENHLTPCDGMQGLVSLYLQAATEKTTNIALLWPGRLVSPPLIHSIACFRLWENGYKRGIRGLFYPSKSNSFQMLNHVFVSRSWLTELVHRLVEPHHGERNELVKDGLPSKDAFLFVSAKAELSKTNLRPCINELLPHFNQSLPGQTWNSYADRFYFRLKKKLPGRKQTKALKECLFEELGSPSSAPDAMFALGYRLSSDQLKSSIRSLLTFGLPDAVLIDGSSQSIHSLDDWRQRIVNFILVLRNVFEERCPGILVVMDDPRHMRQLQAALSRDGKFRQDQLKQHGFAYTSRDLGICPKTAAIGRTPFNREIKIAVIDFEAGDLIEKLHHCAKRLESQHLDASPIWKTSNYLAKLSQCPGSHQALIQELRQRDAPQSTISRYDWLHHKTHLLRFLREGHAFEVRAELEALLIKADRLVEAYYSNTPLGLKVESEVLDRLRLGKTISIVTRSNLYRAVLCSSLKLNEADTASPRIRVVTTSQLNGEIPSSDVLLYADMRLTALRDLVCGAFTGHEIVLILTAPIAWQFKHAIEPLVQMPEFSEFHQHLIPILKEIDNQLTRSGKNLFNDIEFQYPNFKFAKYDEEEIGIPDSEAVLIELENGLLLRRGTHSRVYVYDAIHADGNWGFHAVEARSLQAGQQIFVMSDDLREQIEASLVFYQRSISRNDLIFEEGLRLYHERVQRQVNLRFGGSKTKQAKMLREKLIQRDKSLEAELGNLSYWLDLSNSRNTPFESLAPHAPRHFNAFRAFCLELEFSEEEIQLFWHTVIQPLRGTRRKEGRWLNEIYSRILFEPESAIAYMGIPKETIVSLQTRALDNVFAVIETLHPES